MAVVPEAGHAMPGENPEAFAAIIASTISQNDIPEQYRHRSVPENAADLLADAAPKRKA
jgi:hypothetical protein